MMYVVKLGSDCRNWMWFRSYKSACACGSQYGRSPELNLAKPYSY